MPVPTLLTDLSATIASNSPAGSDNVFPDLDNYLRALSGFLASIRDNSGNGWVSPYLTAANPSYTGTLTGGTGVVNIGSGQLVKDAAGNLGLGVTPSAWVSTAKVIQLGAFSAFFQNSAGYPSVGFNTYQNTSGVNTYQVSSNPASLYAQGAGGTHLWYTAPPGTAGAAISFTQAMTLDASGNLGVGTTSGIGRVVTNSGAAGNTSHGFGIVGLGDTNGATGGFLSVRMVTINGDGGTNSGNTYVSNVYGTKGVCIAAFDSSGNSVSPSTGVANSNLCTFVAIVSI